MSLIAADAVLIDHFTKVDPTLVSGPLRKAAAKYGAGLLVEEGTINLAVNPSFEVNTTGWAQWSGSAALSQDTTHGFVGNSSLKVVPNADNAGVEYSGANSAQVQLGTTITVSLYIYLEEGQSLNVAEVYGGVIGSPASWVPTVFSWERPLVSGQWIRGIATVVTSTVQSSLDGYVIDISGAHSGLAFWIDAVQIEEKPYATEYTDGSLGTGFAWDQTVNLITNPSFETDTAGWTGIGENLLKEADFEVGAISDVWGSTGNCSTNYSSTALSGTHSMAMTAAAAGDMSVTADANRSGNQQVAAPGRLYTAIVHVRAGSTPRRVNLSLRFVNAAGSSVTSQAYGVNYADNASGWTQVRVAGVADTQAATVDVIVNVLGCAAGEVHLVDQVGIFETPLIPGGGVNILDNCDFENGIDNWGTSGSGETVSQDATTVYTGRASLKVTPSAGVGQARYGVGNLSIGQTYTLSCRVKAVVGSVINLYLSTFGTGSIGPDSVTADGTWQLLTITGTAVQTSETIVIDGNSAVVNIDAVKLELGSAATPFVPRQYSNMFLDPQGTHYADASYWTAGQSPGVNLQLVADAAAGQPVGSNTIKSTILAAHSAGQFDFYGVWTHIKSTVAERTVTASAWIKTTAGYKIGLRIIGESDTATYYGGSTSDIQTVVNASGDWQRISVTLPAFAGATGAQLRLGLEGSDAPPVGTVCWITGVQLVQGYDPLPYADGSLGVGYSWDSSENLIDADTSTVEGGVGTWRNLGAAPAFERYTGWSHNGAWSVLYPWGTTNEYAWFPVLCASNTNYALSFWLYNDGVGPTNNRFRIEFYDSVGTGLGSTPYVLSAEISNWRRQVVQVITPPNAVNFRVVFHNESVENQQFFVDDFQVEQRSYATPYGSTGTANQTTSTVKVPWGLTSQAQINRNTGVGVDGTGYLYAFAAQNPNLYGSGVSYKATLAPNTTYTFSASTFYSQGYLLVDGPALTAPVVGSQQINNGQAARYTVTFTTNSAGGVAYLRVYDPTPTGKANGFYTDAVQLEQRAYATPYGNAGAPNTTSSSRVSSVVTFTSEYKVTGSFSIATWFKATRDFTNLHTDFNALFALYHGADQVLSFEDAGSGYITYIRNTANGANQMTNPVLGEVKKGDLVFLAFIFDGITGTTYHSVNNEPLINDGSGVLAGSAYPYIDSLDLGSRWANGPASIGLVWDQFLICDSVLSLNEINKLAFAPSRPTEQDNYRVVFSLDPVAIKATVLATTGNTERALMATQVNVETEDGPIFNQYPSRLDVLTDRAVFNVEDELYLQGYCDRYVVNSIAPDEAGLTRYTLVAAQS